MNYKKIYDSLIERARTRQISGYTELHHIIPRCMGGSDDSSNLARLKPEEHYTAHLLLVKIYPDNYNLIYAAQMMVTGRPSNKLYGWLRRRYSNAISVSQTGTGNSQFGTKWIFNRALSASKKIQVNEEIPLGWELGRVINWEKKKQITHDQCPVCGTLKISLRKFCSHSCSATCSNQSKITIFDKYLDEMIADYQNGMSIYKCLTSRNLCGTGSNHTKLKKELDKIGIKSIRADTSL